MRATEVMVKGTVRPGRRDLYVWEEAWGEVWLGTGEREEEGGAYDRVASFEAGS